MATTLCKSVDGKHAMWHFQCHGTIVAEKVCHK